MALDLNIVVSNEFSEISSSGAKCSSSEENRRRDGWAIFKDRISELPDEILCCMLLLLPTKEAVRSSILSQRWRYMWKTSLYFLPCLTLNVLSMRGSDYSDDMFGVSEAGTFKEDSNLLSIERLKFVKWVDQMLQLDYSPVIDSFRLQFYLDNDFACHIDRWISVAISERVQNFDINLGHFIYQGMRFPSSKLYKFPDRLFTQETGSMVKSLCLRWCTLMPRDFNCFSSLLDMKLEYAIIKQDTFDCLLANCPNLEKLHLVHCWRLVRLKIYGSLLKLKDLAVVHCTIVESIEIDAVNLTRLEYWGNQVNISFLNVPRLSTVIIYLRNYHDSSGINSAMQNLASHVPKLNLLIHVLYLTENPFIPRQLANLTKLVLMISVGVKGTLWGLISLLHASPLLDTLELSWAFSSLHESYRERLMPKPSDSPHQNLKNISLSGFWSSAHEMEFTTYLLNNTTSLKNISILYRKQKLYTYSGGHYISSHSVNRPGADDAQKKLEEQSKQLLMKVVPSGVEIQFM